MAKRCGFCDFSTENEIEFTDHMRMVHGWGAAAPATAVAPYGGLASPLTMPAASGTGDARFCGNCGAARDSLSTNFCRNCGASFVSSAPPAQPVSPAFAPKGGFWRRTGAYIIDIIVTALLGAVAGFLLGIIGFSAKLPQSQINAVAQVLGAFIGVAYFLYFWSRYGHGQTPGMRALKLRVIRTDGTDISIPRAFLRWIGFNIGILVIFIGVIWVAFDRNKQGWHDKLADTYVVTAG